MRTGPCCRRHGTCQQKEEQESRQAVGRQAAASGTARSAGAGRQRGTPCLGRPGGATGGNFRNSGINGRPCGPSALGGMFLFFKLLIRCARDWPEAVGGRVLSCLFRFCGKLAGRSPDARRRRHPPGGPLAPQAQGNGGVASSVAKKREDGVFFAKPLTMAAGLGRQRDAGSPA